MIAISRLSGLLLLLCAGTAEALSVYLPDGVNSVNVLDAGTHSLIATIPVGDNPQDLAITPDGRQVFVVNNQSNSVSVIDALSNTVISNISLSGRLNHAGLSRIAISGRYCFVVTLFGYAVLDVVSAVVNPSAAVVYTHPLFGYPQFFEADMAPDGGRLYVPTGIQALQYVVPQAPSFPVALINPIPTIPGALNDNGSVFNVAVSPDSQSIFVTNFDFVKQLVFTGPTTSAMASPTSYGFANAFNSTYGTIALAPAGNRLFITQYGGQIQWLPLPLSGSAATPIQPMPFGFTSTGRWGFSPDGSQLYVGGRSWIASAAPSPFAASSPLPIPGSVAAVVQPVPPTPGPAPTPITTLTAASAGTQVQLNWAAPGGGILVGNTSAAVGYQIAFATFTLGAGAFGSGTFFPNPPKPLAAGTPQTVALRGLPPGQRVYFEIKAVGEYNPTTGAPDYSLSNVASVIAPASFPSGQVATYAANLNMPQGVAVDNAGNAYVADTGNCVVRKIDVNGIISTVAGTLGYCSSGGDGGPALQAFLSTPKGVAVDQQGNLYIADNFNNAVRKVDVSGRITTLASVSLPGSVAADPSGNVYVTNDYSLVKISSSGATTTVAAGSIQGVAVDQPGNVYYSDVSSYRIYKLAPGGGPVPVAGNGTQAYSGDGGPPLSASFVSPLRLAARGTRLFVLDGPRVRAVDFATNVTTTVAGNGSYGFSGDGQPALSASFYYPLGIATDVGGDVYVADTFNNRIRAVGAPAPPPPSVATSADGVVSLVSNVPGMTIVPASSPSADSVAAYQGLVRVSGIYDLSPSGLSFNPPALVTFKYPSGTITTALVIAKFIAGTGWSFSAVTNQSIDGTAGTISGQTATSSLYAVFARDFLPPRTTINLGQPQVAGSPTFITSATPISFTAVDDGQVVGDGAGVGVAQTQYAIDGGTWTRFASSFTITGDGLHVIRYFSTDLAGNAEAPRVSSVAVDNTPPATQVGISSPVFFSVDGSTFVAATSRVSLSAADPLNGGVAVGTAALSFGVDGAALAPYAGPFALLEGAHVLAYQSRDRLGNLEPLKSIALKADATPPVTQLVIAGSQTVSGGALFVAPGASFGFSAQDPLGGGVASGVGRTLYSLDSGPFAVFAGSFTLPSGPHLLAFQSVDNVGNGEAVKTASFTVRPSDILPPRTTLSVGQPSFGAAPVYISSATRLSLSAVDDALVVGDGAGVGVAQTLYSVDGAPFIPFVAPFVVVSEGAHNVRYYSTDTAGNTEAIRSAALVTDGTPPVSTLAVSAPLFVGSGVQYVAPRSSITISAADPVIAGSTIPGSGVAQTQVSLDGGPFAAYTSAISLPEGVHTLAYRSLDYVGNVEAVRGVGLQSDATPPLTTLAVLGPAFNGFVSSMTRFSLSAADPVVNGVAAGVALTRYEISGGSFAAASAPFGLSGSDGSYSIGYQSVDNVGNVEVLRSTAVVLDQTPPVTTVSIGSPSFIAADGTTYVTPRTPLGFSAVDPSLPAGQPGSGVSRIETSLDGAPFAPYVSPLFLAEGRHTILYRAVDNVANVEAYHTLALQSDATPPVTALAISTPSFNGYVSAATLFSLSAVDPVVSGVASGVAFTHYRINGGAFMTSPLAFRLSGPDGAYQVDYQSQDSVSNLEVLKSTAVFLDQTPPVTTPHIGAPAYVAADGTQYVTPATPVTFTAVDPPSGSVASGVNRIEVALDGGAFALYTAALTFAEGRHAVLYRAVDNVGNVEATKTLSLQSDATPPISAFKASGTYFTASAPEGPRLYAPLAFSYSLPATDPVVNTVASGPAFTRYRTGQLTNYAGGSPVYAPAAFATYASTFSLAEGIRRVDFQSQDNVGNLELLKSATVFVDATPPVTTLTVGAPQYSAGGTLYVSTATPFTLASQDPVVQEVASGVSGIFFHLDAGPFASYSSPFTIPVPDGAHTASFNAVDNVGNQEPTKATTVFLDNTAPQTEFAVVVGRQFPGPDVLTFYASSDTRLALPAADPIVGGGASGMAFTQWRDNGGAFQTYSAPFGLTEGAHRVDYRSQDNVANLEVLRSTNVWIDATAPVTTFAIGAPLYTAPDGTIYVTPATPVAFSASDPNLPTGQLGSGVNRIEVSLDGGAFVPYASALRLTEGRHTVAYRSVDNVGNVEATKTLSLQSDATPPATALAVSTPSFNGYVSAATLFSLSAVDPIVNGVASGVAFTRYRINGGAFAASPLAFRLSGSDGAYQVDYQSQDNVTNLEVLKSTAVFLDQTPPVTTPHVGVPNYVAADGTQYVTPTTPITFTAVDPSSGAVASGVNHIEVALDGGAFSVYAATLTFAEGRHVVLYRAVDNVGNVEATKTLSLQSDATPPATVFKASGTYFAVNAPEGPRLYAPLGLTYSLPATDPVVDNVASGLAFTRYRTGQLTSYASGSPAYTPGAFANYSSTFSLAEGIRRVDFQSQDNVTNLELLKSATVFIDATPPVTTLTVGAPQYSAGGTLYVSTVTPFALASQDPMVQEVASGVSGIFFHLDANAFAAYASTFTIPVPDGVRTASFYAADDVGNLEAVKTSAVALDATPPQTSLALLGGHQFPGPDARTFYASSDTRLALTAFDPVVNGVASGVAWTRWQDNGGTFQAYLSTLSVAEGAHALVYQSQDNVQNLEVLRSTNAWIDATPPVTTVSIGSPTYTAADGTIYVTPATPVAFAASDPNLPTAQPGSGVNHIEVAIDGGAFVTYTSSLAFAEGRHTVAYRSVDNVGNVEAARTLALQSDATPPGTSLAVSTPSFNGFVSAATLFSLSAMDPLVNGVASGVAFTRYRVNGGAFATSLLNFRLSAPDGAYQVDYQSQDNVANLEVLRSTAVFLDQTPPATTPHIGAPNYVASDGTQYVTPAAPVTFTAVDPSSGSVASGVNRIEVALDGGAFAVYASTLTFAEGRHTVLYRAVDNVGNVEATKTLSLQSDATPPVTALKASGSYFTVNAPEGPRLYAPLGFTYSLPATDPVVNNVASGLAFTRYRTGPLTNYASTPNYAPGAFATYASTFGLAEGIRRVDFQSQDNVTNLELLKSATVFVDATPPVTTLTVGAPQYAAGGTLYVSTATPFALASQDPTVQEVASGVSGIFFHLDANAFADYASTFTIPVPDGVHAASFYAADNVGNLEAVKTSTVALDATPPQSSLLVVGGHQFPGPNGSTFYASSDTRLALPAFDPVVNGVASGVAWTRWQDNGGTFQAYLSTLSFAEGAHALGYRSQDNVANLEVLRSTNAWIDATPPVTTVAIGSPTYTAADGTIYVTPATLVTFAAADPSLPTGQAGSGVNHIEVAIDGGAFVLYTSSLTFAEGRHLVLYRAIDNVANVETTKTLLLQSDATPPITELALLGGHQFPGPDSVSFYASAETRYGLPAVDPVVKNVASGVAFTRWQDNGGSFQTFASPFALAEGIHHLGYQSQDNVQNLEVLRSTTALVDATAPITSLAIIGGHQFPGPNASTFYASSDTRLALPAFDPVVSGVASGVAWTRWQDGGGAFSIFATSLTLAEGAHALAYQSQDNVANLEVLRSTNVWIDATPPVTAFAFGAPYYQAPDGTNYVTPATPVMFTASDPNLPTGQAGSGVNRIEVAIDGGPFVLFTSSLTFVEGRHTILYRAVDNVANVEATKTLLIQSDATPPITELALLGGHQFPGPDTVSFYASADTRYSLPAVDPVVKSVASGVAFTRWQDNGGTFQTFTSPFALTEGIHHLGYQSQDNVQNLEVVRSTIALVDATAPLTSLAIIGGHQFPGPNTSTFYASSDTRLALPALDPLVNGVASGVAWTRWQDNGGAFQSYLSTLSFAEGAHALTYQSQDNVANLEVARSTNAWIDATPPVTTFAFGTPYYQAPDGTNYVTPATPITFTASDPNLPTGQPGSDPGPAGSGVNHIEVAIDGGAFVVYMSSLAFAEGRHVILYRAIDNVANVETTKALLLQSDATPPITELAMAGGHQFPGPDTVSFYASADTRYGLPAVDPIVKNVASGVAFTRWQDNGGAFQTFTSAFALAEGIHRLDYQSQDNVQNLEVLRSTTALVDATPPQTSLLVLGGHQFPGPSASTFYASSDTRLALPAFDPVVSGVASGVAWTRWQDNGGAFQAYLSTLSFAEGAHALVFQSQDNVANLEVLRSTNTWIDATPPVTTFAFGAPYYQAPDGTNYVTPATPVTFAASDPNLPSGQLGSGVNRIEVAIDGGPFVLYTSSLTFAEGRHAILYRAVDNVANVEAYHTLALQSDATPPVSSLVIGQPQYQLPNILLVSSRTPFAVAAVDPVVNNVASGVRDTWYNWADLTTSTAAFQQFTASFTLSGLDVNKAISFYSRDNVLNTEVVKSSTVLLDSTPPEIALLSPGSCPGGICRVIKGKFPVLGTAKDLHFAGYVLDFAPGQNASAGFVTIATGAAAVSSGTLGTWDASALSGWQTLRLTATDLVANISILAINVYVGDPATLMLLGNHDVFEMPTGVAAGSDGKIYVADTDADRVAVFTATGAFVAAYGQPHGDRDDGVLSTSTVRFNKPKGVAVDAAGNIYVADTNDDRIVELSPAGQVLLSVGRRPGHDDKDHDDGFESHPGKKLGRFNKPSGLALDAGGNIYIADTNNKRVQVLSSTGAPILAISLPPLPRESEDKDETSDRDDDRRDLGRPFGIAVDAAGRIYVADPDGSRALVYGATGQLLLTVPIAGQDRDGHAVRGRPEGIAVSTDGYCLLVSDAKLARVLKFDANGAQNLSFGARARGDDARAPSGVAFRKPAGLALDAAGNLYVADRNAEKIEKFGLPTGQPTLIVPPPGPGGDDTARDVVSREDGGTVERKDKAAVAIPAQALSDDLKVSVSTPTADVAAAGAKTATDANLKTASPPVDFGPEGTKFSAPVTLTLPYSPDLVARQNGDEASLKVHYWNKDKGQWEDLASQVDAQKHTVTAKTTHFSLYQVFATSTTALKPLASADPTFTFHDGYAFPNPVRGTSVVTLRIQPGLADSVEVHVYDVSGRKVHSSSNFTQNIVDDGNGKGNQYTFDHVWDISGVGSGVYMYVITAKKAGMSDIHKTGRVGVIK